LPAFQLRKLNLNVHLQFLALDGAYSFEQDKARFHRAGALHPGELDALLTTIITRITRTLVRAGVRVVEDEALCEFGDCLAHERVQPRAPPSPVTN
jgi:hypothetical protein